MNGAEALLRTLVGCGIDTCFTNPGTTEIHAVAALDAVPEMRGVLTLFEGVATGAADGFGRMAGRPAATLLHLGAGLGNGLANLHNARRARTPLLNVVGDHATYHKKFDPPLESAIEEVARSVSPAFVRWATAAETVGLDTVEAVRAALGPPGAVATLVVPADVSWAPGGRVAAPPPASVPGPTDPGHVAAIARALREDGGGALLLGGNALHEEPLATANRIAARLGLKLLCETFPARVARGAGRPAPERLAYLGEMAAAQLAGLRHLVLVDAAAPVTFFGSPGSPSWLAPEGCDLHVLCGPADDTSSVLEALAEEVGATRDAPVSPPRRPAVPEGPLTPANIASVIGALLPEDAVVSDESNTGGVSLGPATAGCPPHDWLSLTGGAIGQGLPVAVGAAFACPGRPVLALEADGSSLYNAQAWWTMARYGLDVTTVLFNNRAYAILHMELQRAGVLGTGEAARSLLSLSDPEVDYVSLASSFGLSTWRATTAKELASGLGQALATPGPSLVEAVFPPR